MEKQIINTQDAPKAIGPYAQGILASGFIFTSGQLPLEPDSGKLVIGIKPATDQVIKNVAAILQEAGSSLSNVVKATVYLKSMDDFAAMNEVYTEHFGQNPPARTCFEVAKLPMDACVEIEVIALK